jgi:GTP-binding protein
MSATFFSSTVDFAALPNDIHLHVAMVGRSNVGKSSMINHLTGQKNLARVSSGAGRTQTINLYEIDKRFYLVDLPGYGYAKTSKEQRVVFGNMIRHYLDSTPQLRLILLIIDARIPLTDLDTGVLKWLQEMNLPFAIIMNKMDEVTKVGASKIHQMLEKKYPGVPRLEHTIESGKDRDAILKIIKTAIKTS